jgi:hypothetical protein
MAKRPVNVRPGTHIVGAAMSKGKLDQIQAALVATPSEVMGIKAFSVTVQRLPGSIV